MSILCSWLSASFLGICSFNLSMNALSEHNLLLNIFFTTELKDDSVGIILT